MSCLFFKPSLERYGYKRTVPLAASFFERNEGNGKLLSLSKSYLMWGGGYVNPLTYALRVHNILISVSFSPEFPYVDFSSAP